jgi:hypothetical protein
MIIRLAHYFGQGNHIPVLQSCSDYLRLMYLSYLRYGVQWLEMWIAASQLYSVC